MAQQADAPVLKTGCYGFESHSGHQDVGFAEVVQMADTPVSKSGCCGFESRPRHHYNVPGWRNWKTHQFEKLGVVGSNPTPGTNSQSR